MPDFDTLMAVGAVLFFLGLFFMWGREFVWWYWGINQALRHLASIDESLKQLPAVKDARLRSAQRDRVAS